MKTDAEIKAMQAEWHRTKDNWVASGSVVGTPEYFVHKQADDKLTAALWNNCKEEIAEDRRKHPKAKRNQPATTASHGNPMRRLIP